MKIAVSGSTGFIGTHLIKRLSSLDHEVIEVKRKEIGKKLEVDRYYFLSAYGNHYDQEDLDSTVKANVTDLARALRNTKTDLFVYFSTSAVKLPTLNHYAVTKYAGELIAGRYPQSAVIRPLSIYGEGESDQHLIPTLVRRMLKGQDIDLAPGVHDWMHVEDFIDALMLIDVAFPQPMEIGTGIQTTNGEIYDIVKDILGKKAKSHKVNHVGKMRTYDTDQWVADMRVLQALKFVPKHSLKEGLKQTVAYYEKRYR